MTITRYNDTEIVCSGGVRDVSARATVHDVTNGSSIQLRRTNRSFLSHAELRLVGAYFKNVNSEILSLSNAHFVDILYSYIFSMVSGYDIESHPIFDLSEYLDFSLNPSSSSWRINSFIEGTVILHVVSSDNGSYYRRGNYNKAVSTFNFSEDRKKSSAEAA